MRVFLTCTERLVECVFWLHSLNFQMQLWSFDLLHLWWNIKEIGHIGLDITEVNCQQVLIWVNAYTELFWATIQKTVSQSLTFKEFFHISKFGWSEMFSFFKIQFSVDYRSNTLNLKLIIYCFFWSGSWFLLTKRAKDFILRWSLDTLYGNFTPTRPLISFSWYPQLKATGDGRNKYRPVIGILSLLKLLPQRGWLWAIYGVASNLLW